MSNNESDKKTSEPRVHYVLIDRNGPVAEFETWEDAFHCMAARKLEGSSIIRCDGPIRERPRLVAGSNDRPESSVASAASARGQAGRDTPEQSVPKPITKVLVISEDVPTLLALTQIVKAAGHGVAISRSTADAVPTIGREKPDLIIVDVDGTAEHGWDGFHVVEWLRCHHPDHRAKYIVVSAGDPEKFRVPAAGAEACPFVEKPIVKESLLTEIVRAIGVSPELDRSQAKPRLLDR